MLRGADVDGIFSCRATPHHDLASIAAMSHGATSLSTEAVGVIAAAITPLLGAVGLFIWWGVLDVASCVISLP